MIIVCHCIVRLSSIYRFWLSLWYRQTFVCRFWFQIWWLYIKKGFVNLGKSM